jgi:biotin carboxylase
MPVTDVLEKVDLVLAREQGRADRVHGGITPALIIEPALLVEVVEELGVGFASPEIEVANLEV